MAQAYATYPGIAASNVISFTGSSQVGITPGRFTLVCDSLCTPAAFGDLEFGVTADATQGLGVQVIQIPACALVQASYKDGRFTVILEDRRWRWKYGVISGRYNTPKSNASGVQREKTPAELLDLLWAEMNETALDTSDVPTDPRPEVDWYASNTAEELNALLSDLGCVLAPSTGGGWKVWPVGQGSVYEAPERLLSPSVVSSQGRYPDQVAFFGEAVQYEVVFLLEPVGLETDGTIKPIDELSYAPGETHGWQIYDSSFKSVTSTYEKNGQTYDHANLARQSVRRWFRVASMPEGGGANSLNPPGWDESLPDVESLDQFQIIPLINEINDEEGTEGFGERKPFEVWGKHVIDLELEIESQPGQLIEDGTLDADAKVVKFTSEKRETAAEYGLYVPADIYLRCVVEVEDPTLGVPVFYARYLDTGLSNGTGAEVIRREELKFLTLPQWNADGTLSDPITTNEADVELEADYYLTARAARYAERPSGTQEFDGLHPVPINGYVTSVTWRFDSRRHPVTAIGIGSKANPYVPDYEKKQSEHKSRAKQLKEQRQANLRARGLLPKK